MPGVDVLKLESTDAFVVRDLGPDVPSAGIVRSAPKVLVDGAVLLARTVTYAFASFEQKVGGASAGINTPPDTRADAVKAFVAEVEPAVAAGLVLDAAKGVAASELAPLAPHESRSQIHRDHAAELRGLGAAICADAAGGLDGRAVVIEGFDDAGPELVRAVYDRGGRVVAAATAKGCVAAPKGLDGAMLAQAWREHGPAMVEHADVLCQPAATLWEQDADVLFCGSKTGLVDHDLAATLRVSRVVPTGAAPVTAKALFTLRRADITVLPDFITTAAPLFALTPGDGATLDGVRAAASVALLGALGEVLDHPNGPVLAACDRAERFLLTWQDELPTYRPLA
jgi:glutamate dehydrogenase/leucine dehydrogenase